MMIIKKKLKVSVLIQNFVGFNKTLHAKFSNQKSTVKFTSIYAISQSDMLIHVLYYRRHIIYIIDILYVDIL